ncbi:MAG: hypothetical protein ACYSR4_04275, partial [Planctomycetota bacterium]
MCRKCVFLSFVAVVLGLASSAFPADGHDWTGLGDGYDWEDEYNWSPEEVPEPCDWVFIYPPPVLGPEISDDITISAIYGPSPWSGSDQSMEIEDGDLVVTDEWWWCGWDSGTATIDMVDYSPTVTIEGPWIAADSASGAAAIVNMAGHASVYVYGDMEGAMASGTSFELNMSEDAYLEVSGGWLRVADDSGASAAINMSDSATLEVYDILRGSDTGSAWFATNMSGGYLFCYGFSIGDEGGGEVNIDGGTMDVDGDMDLGGARGSDP